MAVLDDMKKRHAQRCSQAKDMKQLRPPLITDSESVKEHNKMTKDLQVGFLDACFLIEADFNVLIQALEEACGKALVPLNIEELVRQVWERQRLDQETLDALNRRRVKEVEAREKETQAREKEHQKNGKVPDVPGQQKLFDEEKMPSAEAAGPVTTRRIEAVE